MDRTILIKRNPWHLASVFLYHYAILIEVVHLAVLDTVRSLADTSLGIAVAFGFVCIVCLAADFEPAIHVLPVFVDIGVAVAIMSFHNGVFSFGICVNLRMNTYHNGDNCHNCENFNQPLFHF